MCGIFGYVGKKTDAAALVLDGLKLLEYRGYDSWGITVKTGKTLKVDKHIGKIGDAKVALPNSTLGIGHTRWATHGGITDKNAHPHLDCRKEIAVIHNGIIENYSELKQELNKKGHSFISETDTEVFSHLVEEYLKSSGFATAVRTAFNRLTGLNAVVIANALSKEIIAAKNGSPLVVGMADDGLYLSSDISGIVKHTRNVLFVKNNEMVILGENLQLIALATGKKVSPSFEKIDWTVEDVGMGKYDHFMIKEIHEQPTVVRNLTQNYSEQITALARVVKNAQGTFFIGAGTAFHACLAGTYLFSKIAKKHVNTAVASEFTYLTDFLTDKGVVIALSQSGETIDVIEPLQAARLKQSRIVGIVNNLGSSIYRMADIKILLGAGPEKAVASTKAYIAKITLLLLLASEIAGKMNVITADLLKAASEIERLLSRSQLLKLKTIAKKLQHSEHIYTIGRGVSYPTAMEAALKIKEVSYIHTEGLAGGELKHGTIALISRGTPCIVFAPHDETYDSMLSNAMEIKSRGGVIIGVSHKNSDIFDYWIEVKDCGLASIIPHIIPAQVLAYYLAALRGYDPDKPRNLAKSVTVK